MEASRNDNNKDNDNILIHVSYSVPQKKIDLFLEQVSKIHGKVVKRKESRNYASFPELRRSKILEFIDSELEEGETLRSLFIKMNKKRLFLQGYRTFQRDIVLLVANQQIKVTKTKGGKQGKSTFLFRKGVKALRGL